MFAISLGALAAGGAALILDGRDDGPALMAATANNLTYPVGPFVRVASQGPQDLVITRGDTISVRSEGDPRALGQLEAVVEDGTLSIRPKNGFGNNWGSLAGAVFYVTVPRLEGLSLAGSGSVRIDQVEGRSFAGNVVGPGEVTIGDLAVEEANFSLAGTGNLFASGTARETRVSIAGTGEVRAEGLKSETAEVSIGGTGNAALTVARQAQVSVLGPGEVSIMGTARCTVSRMGPGEVTCGGREVP